MNMLYTTSNFAENLLNSIIAYMNENRVAKMPLSFLASGNYGFPQTTAIAKNFIERGHWDYFFTKDNKLFIHLNYRGEYGLGEYDEEVVAVPRPYPANRNTYDIHTSDLVELVRVVYDTIGNTHFTGRGVETLDCSEIDELENEYTSRRNEAA